MYKDVANILATNPFLSFVILCLLVSLINVISIRINSILNINSYIKWIMVRIYYLLIMFILKLILYPFFHHNFINLYQSVPILYLSLSSLFNYMPSYLLNGTPFLTNNDIISNYFMSETSEPNGSSTHNASSINSTHSAQTNNSPISKENIPSHLLEHFQDDISSGSKYFTKDDYLERVTTSNKCTVDHLKQHYSDATIKNLLKTHSFSISNNLAGNIINSYGPDHNNNDWSSFAKEALAIHAEASPGSDEFLDPNTKQVFEDQKRISEE